MKYQHLILLLAFQSNLIFSSSAERSLQGLKKYQKAFFVSPKCKHKECPQEGTPGCCKYIVCRSTTRIEPAKFMGKSPNSESLVIQSKGHSYEIPKEKIFLQKNPEKSHFKVGETVYKKNEGKRNKYHRVKILAFNLVDTNKVIICYNGYYYGILEQIEVNSLFKSSGTFHGLKLGKNKSISEKSKAILLGFNPSTDELIYKERNEKNEENFRVVSRSDLSWTRSWRNKIDGFRVGDIVKPKSYYQGRKAKILALNASNKKAYVKDLETEICAVFSLDQLVK